MRRFLIDIGIVASLLALLAALPANTQTFFGDPIPILHGGTGGTTQATAFSGVVGQAQVGLNQGGTAADLSATGGASQFLRQNGVGSAVTVVRPACADLSNGVASCSTDTTNAANISSGTLPAARTNGHMNGTATNDNAAAGEVGEIQAANVLIGAAISLTTGTAANVTTITLAAGDWDISAQATFDGTGASTVQGLRASIATTSATENTVSPNFWSSSYGGAAIFTTFDVTGAITPIRQSLSGSQQFWLVARCNFTAGTCLAYGSLRARRMR